MVCYPERHLLFVIFVRTVITGYINFWKIHSFAAPNIFNFFNTVTDKPNYILPDDSVSKTIKAKWLLELCESFIDKYIFASGDVTCLVQQTQELDLATLGHYNCRVDGCDKAFVYHSGRVR